MKSLHTLAVSQLFIVSQILAADPCIPATINSPVTSPPSDDAPAIRKAIETCGPTGGTILFPQKRTWWFHSRIDFFPCNTCTFQIEGHIIPLNHDAFTLKDPYKPIFYLDNVHGATIIGKNGTGLVSGNVGNQPTPLGPCNGVRRPMFNITGGSSNITISNLNLQDSGGDFFAIENASNIVFEDMRVGFFGSPKVPDWLAGFRIRNSTNIKLLNTTVTSTGTCLVDEGKNGIDLRGLVCKD